MYSHTKKPGIEERACRACHDDGLLEIFLGLALIGFGLGSALHEFLFMILLPSVALPVWMLAKKAITQPRYGHVTFGPSRQRRINKEMIFYVAFFTMTALSGVAVGIVPAVQLVVLSVMLLPIGMHRLMRFLRTFPHTTGENANGGL